MEHSLPGCRKAKVVNFNKHYSITGNTHHYQMTLSACNEEAVKFTSFCAMLNIQFSMLLLKILQSNVSTVFRWVKQNDLSLPTYICIVCSNFTKTGTVATLLVPCVYGDLLSFGLSFAIPK